MDGTEKRTLAVCTAIIAAPRLQFIAEQNPVALKEAIYDAVLKAENLMRQIEARYPAGPASTKKIGAAGG